MAAKTRELDTLRAEIAKSTQERQASDTSGNALRKHIATLEATAEELAQAKILTETQLSAPLKSRETASEEVTRLSLFQEDSLKALAQEKWTLTEQALTETLTQGQVVQVTLSRDNEKLGTVSTFPHK
ncbi:MAG: hypothetical protein ACI8T1_002360 [Verrucomicrobiales bacterium]